MTIVRHDAFTIIGIEARTANEREMTADGVIGKQWERLMRQNLLSQIPHKADPGIVAVYTDYESDEHGPYTFILGARVSSVGDVPQGMVVKMIPAARYAVFTSRRGPVTEVVLENWKRIWEQPQTDEYTRIYTADFEVYDERAANPGESIMDIYIAVK